MFVWLRGRKHLTANQKSKIHVRSNRTTNFMKKDIKKNIISSKEIRVKIKEIANQIINDFKDETEIVIVSILSGSILFTSDLIRHLPLNVKVCFLTVQSYPGKTTVSKNASIVYENLCDLKNKNVIIIDDILDSGKTLKLVKNRIIKEKCKDVKTCVLLRKPKKNVKFKCDYIGFDIPNEFVVGYGLDYNGYYRNLPNIAVLKEKIFNE